MLVFRAVKQSSNISCIWKLMGDSCLLIAKLPKSYCFAYLLKALVEGKEVAGIQQLQKYELYTLAARYIDCNNNSLVYIKTIFYYRCFSKSLSLVQDNVLIWHDLATCYLMHACETNDKEKATKLFDLSLQITKHCTNVNPTYWQHWNLLGNIYCKKGSYSFLFG